MSCGTCAELVLLQNTAHVNMCIILALLNKNLCICLNACAAVVKMAGCQLRGMFQVAHVSMWYKLEHGRVCMYEYAAHRIAAGMCKLSVL